MSVSTQVRTELCTKKRHNLPHFAAYSAKIEEERKPTQHRVVNTHIWGIRSMLLTIKDVENKLKVSRSSVYRLISTGNLDIVHIGQSIRVTEDSLETFVTLQTTFGTAVPR